MATAPSWRLTPAKRNPVASLKTAQVHFRRASQGCAWPLGQFYLGSNVVSVVSNHTPRSDVFPTVHVHICQSFGLSGTKCIARCGTRPFSHGTAPGQTLQLISLSMDLSAAGDRRLPPGTVFLHM